MKIEPYDFRRPGRLVNDVEESLTKWFSAFCARVPDRWAKQMSARLTLAVRAVESLRLDESLGQLGKAVVAYRVAFESADPNSLLVVSRPLLLLLAACLVGDPATEVPEDRELTLVEESLAEHFVEQYLVNGLQESWPGVRAPLIQLGPRETDPQYCRLMPPETLVIVCSFLVRGPYGEQLCRWIVNQKVLLGFLAHVLDTKRPGASEQESRRQMEELVSGLRFELSVSLGELKLPLSALASLRIGDLLLLDQRTSDPLHASIAGVKKLRVWPGRVGRHQAVQIESCFEA